MKYLQTLVKIPELGPDPPSFLLPGQLIEMELARQVRLTALLDEEASIGSLIEPGEVEPPEPTPPPEPRPTPTSQFDSQFGAARTNERFDFEGMRSPVKDERCVPTKTSFLTLFCYTGTFYLNPIVVALLALIERWLIAQVQLYTKCQFGTKVTGYYRGVTCLYSDPNRKKKTTFL